MQKLRGGLTEAHREAERTHAQGHLQKFRDAQTETDREAERTGILCRKKGCVNVRISMYQRAFR